MPKGTRATSVFPVRLTPKTLAAIKTAARLQGCAPCTLARTVLAGIFDGLGEDVILASTLRERTQALGLQRPEVTA